LPNALGVNSSKSINVAQRDINSTMVGRIGIIESSKSDPGQAGYIIPFAKMDGMYFDGSLESNDGSIELNDLMKQRGYENFIGIECGDVEEYNQAVEKMLAYNEKLLESFEVVETLYEVPIEPEELTVEEDKS
jgi:hypothetical protein